MRKLSVCSFCKNEIINGNKCNHCGEILFSGTGNLFYSEKAYSVNAVFLLTEKYLLISSNAGGVFGAIGAGSFGVVGAVVGSLADAAFSVAKNKTNPYGFYDLNEIKQVFYPYPLKRLKKECTFRIENLDGSDMVLTLDKKEAIKFAEILNNLGIGIQNSESQIPGKVYCQKPFITAKTYNNRVANSAGSFVRLMKHQFIAPAIASTQYKSSPLNKVCSNCGEKLSDGFNFCTQCGNKIENGFTFEEGKKICSECGSEVSGAFCTMCGTKYIV